MVPFTCPRFAAHVLGVVTAHVDGLVSEMAYFIRRAKCSSALIIIVFPPANVCGTVVDLNLFISVRAFSESGPSEWAPAAQFITPPKAHRKV